MKLIMRLIFMTLIATSMIFAQTIIGYTSFEEPATGNKYTDTGDAATDHALVNNAGEADVNYEPGTTGSELGFSAYYTNSRDDVGITDGDYIGVTTYTPTTDATYPDGSQGYQLSDTDGLVTVSIDTVELTSTETYSLAMYYYINDDGYETDDYIRIFVTTDAGTTELLNTNGSDIDDLGIEGQWTRLATSITGATYAIVSFELDCNSGNEALYIDNIVISQGELQNIPPVANAGNDQSAGLGATVTLNGSGSSDEDGSIEAWQWTQILGETVTLATPTAETTTFTAPGSAQTLEFTLTVTDDGGDSDTDTVSVVVKTIETPTLIISEYIDGSTGNNKFLEICNIGDAAIDLNSENISLASSSNGANDFTANDPLSDWGSLSVIEPGEVIVMASDSYDFEGVTPDTLLAYPAPIYFNGNDAVALTINGVIFDLLGDPTSDEAIIADMVLRRNSNVSQPNAEYDSNEWTQGTQDDVSGLGNHSNNPDAPVISSIAVSPDFVTSSTEIEISAIITAVNSISSVVVNYGVDGNLNNTSDVSWEDDPESHEWIIQVPAQSGNSTIDFKIVATDANSNTTESAVMSFTVADANAASIADIHTNIESLTGTVTTVKGIVTIGSGKLRSDRTSDYIQDASGRGLNLYDSEYYELNRGDEVMAVGEVDLYYTTVEVKYFNYQVISTGNDLPAAIQTTVAGANSADYEGTLIQFTGELAEIHSLTDGTKLTIADGTDSTVVMIWNSTGIDVSGLTEGNTYRFQGVGSAYSGVYQLLVAYDDDITDVTAIDEEFTTGALSFKLNPAYPNPFNPTTHISWQLDKTGEYSVSLYNMLGQKVQVLEQGVGKAGLYSKTLQAGDLPSGVYFLRLESGHNQATQKIMLLK